MLQRTFVALGLSLVSVSAAGQGRGAVQPPPTDTVAPAIPGVVAAGTPVHVIKDGFNGSEGPIALPDGSVIFSETTANRTIKIDASGTVSVFLENTGGANGMSFDTDGRLFATTYEGESMLYRLDPATGAATMVGGTGIGFVHSAEFSR